MTYKQREAMREVRLWISQVIVPASTAVILMATNPELRQAVSDKVGSAKQALKNKFKRE